MKSLKLLLVCCSLIFSASVSQAAIVQLVTDSDPNGGANPQWPNIGDADSQVDVSSILNGTVAGDTWGGTALSVEFTNAEMIDVGGNIFTTSAGSPEFYIDANGLGVDSHDIPSSENRWELNPQEGWTWTANSALSLYGFTLRPGWGGAFGTRSLLIHSDDWVGLTGITPGAGITFNAGTFNIQNTSGAVSLDNIVTREELVGVGGPDLEFDANGITITSSAASSNGFSITSFTFESSGLAAVPEPGTSVLVVFGSLLLYLFRKKGGLVA